MWKLGKLGFGQICLAFPLLIYERAGKLHAYKKTAVDKMLTELGDRVGFRFTNHDLRRTFGRMMYRAGVKIEEIARIFGHSDTRTMMRHLGLDMEDMSSAMGQLAAYQASTYFPKTERNILSQEKSGQSGILIQETDWLEPDLYREWYNERKLRNATFDRGQLL